MSTSSSASRLPARNTLPHQAIVALKLRLCATKDYPLQSSHGTKVSASVVSEVGLVAVPGLGYSNKAGCTSGELRRLHTYFARTYIGHNRKVGTTLLHAGGEAAPASWRSCRTCGPPRSPAPPDDRFAPQRTCRPSVTSNANSLVQGARNWECYGDAERNGTLTL